MDEEEDYNSPDHNETAESGNAADALPPDALACWVALSRVFSFARSM